MNVGYYFHPPAKFAGDGVACTEAHWAYFIRALAAELGEVTYYAHSSPTAGLETMPLGPEWNIRCVDLGRRGRRPLMYFFPRKYLANFTPESDALDAVIVRGPTALLAPIAKKARRAGIPALGLLVDDTSNWRGRTGISRFRIGVTKLWLRYQARAIARVGRDSLMMAISNSIVRDPNFRRTAIVPTTSLSRVDLTGPDGRTRAWPAPAERIRLLFTGRIQTEKGLHELVDALHELVQAGHNLELEFVGQTYGDTTIDRLLEQGEALGISDRLIYTGFLEAGPALLAAYDNADVFVLPTYGEGSVTRTIKEAFARGLPVVTTTVREIAEFLTDGKEAVLVPAGDRAALAAGIERVLTDPALRDRMTREGFAWVQGYTNEASATIVAGHVRAEIDRMHGAG